MALYLVVRHQQKRQTFHNIWLNDELLTSIETTLKIGRLCRTEKDMNHRVYIHRCGYGDWPPIICCSVCIAEVTPTDNPQRVKILFRDQTQLNDVPIVKPKQHQNYYFEPSL
jgi:hypothetical protein